MYILSWNICCRICVTQNAMNTPLNPEVSKTQVLQNLKSIVIRNDALDLQKSLVSRYNRKYSFYLFFTFSQSDCYLGICFNFFLLVCRQQLRAGQRSSAGVPDRVLFGRVLRADGLGARAYHAEGLRVQVPSRARHEGRAPARDRHRAGIQARTQARTHLL